MEHLWKSYSWRRIVTWPMTSRDLERSRSWLEYIWTLTSQNLLEIECRFQWSTYRKSYMASRMVTWSMTSCVVPEWSTSKPEYLWGLIPRKQFTIVGWCHWNTYRKSADFSSWSYFVLLFVSFSFRANWLLLSIAKSNYKITFLSARKIFLHRFIHSSIRTFGMYFILETYMRILTYVVLGYVSYVKHTLSFFVVILLLLRCIITALWDCEFVSNYHRFW